MRSDRALCPHLAAARPGPAPFTLATDEILAWADGPLEAIVRCRACGACGWLERLGEEPRRFALAAVRAEDVALYFRNRARGSCDVGRAGAEYEALAASHGPFERIVELDTERGVLLRASIHPAAEAPAS